MDQIHSDQTILEPNFLKCSKFSRLNPTIGSDQITVKSGLVLNLREACVKAFDLSSKLWSISAERAKTAKLCQVTELNIPV